MSSTSIKPNEQALVNLATFLKEKGFNDKEVADTLMDVITQIHLETVEELMKTLPSDKQELLEKLSEENTPAEEIFEKLELDSEEIAEIQGKKFTEIVDEMMPIFSKDS